jgi:hypothetical protein
LCGVHEFRDGLVTTITSWPRPMDDEAPAVMTAGAGTWSIRGVPVPCLQPSHTGVCSS